MKWRSAVVVAFALVSLMAPASAATITVGHSTDDFSTIRLTGTLVWNDVDQFRRKTAAIPYGKGIVSLMSDGGSVYAALAIGTTVHDRGYGTLVPSHSTCASACGLIWLSANIRAMSDTAMVGFHGAYDAYTGQESSIVNAVVGAYLEQLGISHKAIAYITHAGPQQMRWLTPQQAAAIG